MNRESCGGGVQDSWAGVVDAVAAALADRPSSRENGSQHPHSLLAAVAGATPPGLRSRLRHHAADDGAAGRPIEPLLHQTELPVYLLGSGIIDVAAHAVAMWRKGVADGPAADNSAEVRVLASVAISALSTLRLEVTGDDAVLAHVRARIGGFDASGWAEALASLAGRTRELHDLLWAARNTRNHQWPHVSLEDQILAEAVAAAVVSGAAAASEVPPQQWLFPFHLFCRVAVSAAEDGLAAIERWLGIDFLPAPRTIERSVSLAVLATEQAASLWQGCACKTGTDPAELAYDPRGRCRQPDHDLRSWQPGKIRPGSRNGSRYASTLWGWLRRWLGGTGGGRAPDAGPHGYARPHTNDVAGSVLARRWLSADRGADGPVLLYDRILPEFCLRCGSKVRLVSRVTGTGRTQVERVCCASPQRVYRSDFNERNGKRTPRPKLGIVIVGEPGRAGYCSTRTLGPLWLCRVSGRYSRSRQYCPECGPSPGPEHDEVRHGWVWLPREQAWQDLKHTAQQADSAGEPAAEGTVTEADLRYLERIFAEVVPGTRPKFATPADVWVAAQDWSIEEMDRFRDLAGRPGLELLLRCKGIAQEADQNPADGH
jgi:hypothetical protein